MRGVAAGDLTLPGEVVAAAMSHMPDLGVVVFDHDYRVLASYGTIPFRRGFAHEALIGRRVPDVVTTESWAGVGPVYAAALAGRALTVDALPDDTGVILELSGSPVRHDGRIVGGSVSVRDVTELRATQVELKRVAREFESFVDTSLDGHYRMSADGVVLWASPSMVTLTGKPMAQIVGIKARGVVHPEDVAIRDAAMAELLRTRAPQTFEVRGEHADGTWHWFEGTLRGLFNDAGELVELHNTTRDVTQRRADEELRRQWQLSFEQAPIGMALVSTTGCFMRVNAALCRLLQRSEAELLAADFQQLTHPDDLDPDLALLRETLAGGREFYEMHKRYLTPTGAAVHAWLSVSLVRHPDGSPAHFISQIVDLTRAHHAESQLQIIEDRHRIASDLHDHVVQGLFAAGLSLQMLESAVGEGPLADQLSRSINEIDQTIARIRSTIYGLRASRGGSPVSVRDRVHDVLAEVAPLFQWPPAIFFDGPLEFMVSQELLEQVVVVLRDALTEIAHHDRDDQVQVALTVAPELGELRIEVTVAGDPGPAPRLSWSASVA